MNIAICIIILSFCIFILKKYIKVKTAKKLRSKTITEQKQRDKLIAEEILRKKAEADEKQLIKKEIVEKRRIRAEKRYRESIAEQKQRDKLIAEEILRKKAEAAEKLRLEAEVLEKQRREAAEQRRLKAETTEKLRLEAEAAEKQRIKAEALEKQRREAAEQRRLKAEAAEKLRLELEAEQRKQKLVSFRSSIKNGYPYTYLTDYFPLNNYPNQNLNSYQVQDRKNVWSFKDGNYGIAVTRVVDFLKTKYTSDKLKDMILCVIPASTTEKNTTRFYQFCNQVSYQTGIVNGFNLISLSFDRDNSRQSKGNDTISNLNFNSSFFRGRDVVVFDDVITRGTSFYQMAYKLKSLGVVNVEGLFLSKTVDRYDVQNGTFIPCTPI